MRNFTLFAAVLLLSVNFHAQAQPLATVHMSAKGGGRIVSGGMIVAAEYSMGISNNATLFNNVVWTPDMAGQSVFETAGAGLSYDNFISLLTDGANEQLGWHYTQYPSTGGGRVTKPEASIFTTHPLDWDGFDLQGYSIGGVELHMNQISIRSPGQNPNHDGIWTDYSWDALLTIYAVLPDTVPEPGVGSLLLLGGLGGWWRLRSRARP